jgi:glucose/mannose-6-phosphate isomerase
LPKPILDDVGAIQKIDKSDMLSFHINASNHYKESAKNAEKIKLDYPCPENIIISGMGGSAIGGELLKDYIRATASVPIEINREYHLPKYANKRSLVILASYSGDTEETLSSLLDAVNRKCMIFCLSSGGNLIRLAEMLNVPYLQVRSGMPPRAALPHMLMPLLNCMEQINMIPKNLKEFSEATKVLEKISDENAPNKIAVNNTAKKLALNLNDVMPVIYGFGLYRGVALRFKQQFNENAKVPGKWEYFSELNHNETMGWENARQFAKYYSVILIRDEAEPQEIRSRIETTKTLMKPSISKIFEIWAQGKGNLSKILSTILVGDFASVYLALLRNLDPTPVDTVTIMKEKIEENGVKEKIIRELEKASIK